MQAKTSFDKNHSTSYQKLSVIGMLPVPEFFLLRMEDLKFKGTYAHYIIKVGLYHYILHYIARKKRRFVTFCAQL